MPPCRKAGVNRRQYCPASISALTCAEPRRALLSLGGILATCTMAALDLARPVEAACRGCRWHLEAQQRELLAAQHLHCVDDEVGADQAVREPALRVEWLVTSGLRQGRAPTVSSLNGASGRKGPSACPLEDGGLVLLLPQVVSALPGEP